MRPIKRSTTKSICAAVVSLTLVGSSVTLGTTPAFASGPRPAVAAARQYMWPKYAHDASDTGVSRDPAISTANASRLGVKWMAPNQTDMESSPVVGYDKSLGKALLYSANEAGGFTAYNAATGAIVWSRNLGSSILSTPIVANGAVWVIRQYSPELFKLDATTGSILCHSNPLGSMNMGTPTFATPPGGKPSVYIGETGGRKGSNGPVYAINASDCSTEWTFTKYNSSGGTWDPDSYAVDAKGRGLLLFGSDNPDATVYALNAVTGAKVWSYQTQNVVNGDVGTGASVTAPGVNGFADGALYITNNGGYDYALNLTTGKLYWRFNYQAYLHKVPGRGTAAVLGKKVIIPGPTGVLCLNAVTGAVVWNWVGDAPSDSAAAVVGPAGKEVVAVTDLAGNFDVLNAATGKLIYKHQTGGFGVTSVAEADGNFYVASGSGFLYDFGVGGSNSKAPTGAVTSPAAGSMVANPDGDLDITGTAKGASVAAVEVAVQTGGANGDWWHAAARKWGSGFDFSRAKLARPGAASTKWTFALPVPPRGGSYLVQVTAVDADGQADISGFSSEPSPAHVRFTVNYLPSAPHLAVTGSSWVAPGTSVAVTGSGFSAKEQVAVSLAGRTLVTASANGSGHFSASVPVPATAGFGLSALVAKQRASGKSSSAVIEVSNKWAGTGYSSLHTADEPNDLTWDHHFVGSHSQYITQAWSYPAGGVLLAQPAVVHDVAYFGDNKGTVTALDVQNSEPVWTYRAGSAVDSTPAVASGLVFFGTAAGAVDAVSRFTGKLTWTKPTSSGVKSAPTVASGKVFVGSNDGTVYSFVQATGQLSWKVHLSGAVVGSPTVDPRTGEVIVGDASGAVTALSIHSGAKLWSVSTGGAVDATTSVSSGDVLVGSRSGKIYALKETTGKVVWKYQAAGPVTGSGAIFQDNRQPPSYLVGDNKGDVYFLAVSDGKLIRHFTGPSGVTGTASAPGLGVVSFSNGEVFADKFNDELTWEYKSTKSEAPAVLLNGVIYVAGQDAMVRAFTIPGTQIP